MSKLGSYVDGLQVGLDAPGFIGLGWTSNELSLIFDVPRSALNA